jgi:hypothetical protein
VLQYFSYKLCISCEFHCDSVSQSFWEKLFTLGFLWICTKEIYQEIWRSNLNLTEVWTKTSVYMLLACPFKPLFFFVVVFLFFRFRIFHTLKLFWTDCSTPWIIRLH